MKTLGPLAWVSIDETAHHLARIDTGAARSSIDIRLVRGIPRLSRKRRTRSVNGVERRDYVKIWVHIAGHAIKAEFSVADRSAMPCPILIGRDILAGRFLVDCSAYPSPANTKK